MDDVLNAEDGMLGSWLMAEAEEQAAAAAVRSRTLFRYYGPTPPFRVDDFEARVRRDLGVAAAAACSSGTAALRMAMAALRPPPGAEVIVPACTFVATANAVVLSGLVPVFAEVDARLGLDPASVESRITPRTVGVIPVHLQGVACRIGELAELAARRGLWLVEDAAQALGVRVGSRAAGSFGAFGAFSLQAHKTITCGEGGLLVSSDSELMARARRFHDQGGARDGHSYPSWDHPEAGFGDNLKMSELAAAVALAQMDRLAAIRIGMRRIHAGLARVDLKGRLPRLPRLPEGAIPYSFQFFAHDNDDQARLLENLRAHRVAADGGYGTPVYQLAPFRRWAAGEAVPGCPRPDLRPRFEPCPLSEALLARIVRIPFAPVMDDAQVTALAGAMARALEDCA